MLIMLESTFDYVSRIQTVTNCGYLCRKKPKSHVFYHIVLYVEIPMRIATNTKPCYNKPHFLQNQTLITASFESMIKPKFRVKSTTLCLQMLSQELDA